MLRNLKILTVESIYLTSPEYMGEYAKHIYTSRANIIGGCCGTSPEHIHKMRNAINALKPSIKIEKVKKLDISQKPDVQTVPKENKSRLARRLSDGHFVTFVEILAHTAFPLKKEIEKARELNYNGIDVINIPDGPRQVQGCQLWLLAVQIQREVGI